MADVDDSGRHKVSRNAKLPQHGFSAIRPQVATLAELAAPSSKERIAEQLGVAAKGRFLGKLAAAGYYGFVERVGDKYQVTDRGRAFLSSNSDESRRAMREGTMSTNFGSIIHLLRSQEPKDSVVAARLQDDQDVPAGSAPAVAKTLIAVATEAGLVGENGRFSSSAIEDTTEALGSLPEPSPVTPTRKPQTPTPKPKPKQDKLETKPNGKPAESTRTELGSPSSSKLRNAGGQNDPLGAAPVQVVVNVDASKLSAREIAELVRALRSR